VAAIADDIQLEVRRFFAASPEQVFAAWTEAEAIAAWFAPTVEMTTIVHTLDARPGGSYRIEMRAANGAQHIVQGRYVQFASPDHLAFTWRWEGKEDEESLVDIRLTRVGDGCELVLRHTRFATAASRDGHQQGWDGCLTRLATRLSTN